MATDFWQRKRVVVTGGAGMVGVQLVGLLIESGADVTVLDNMSRGRNKLSGADYIVQDAGDENVCIAVFEGADAVFNLAAEVAGVGFNQSHHVMMFERNMRLLAAPLSAAVKVGVERFLQVSSVCVYAPGYNNPAREENGHEGNPTPANVGYSWAKRMGERLAGWYTRENGIHTVIVRPSNIYGPHDYFDERGHVIPNLIKQVLNDKPYVEVHGDGQTYREFLYSADAASGMAFALAHGEPGEVYNLGTNGRTKINTRELLTIIEGIVGVKKERRPVVKGDTGDGERWSDCGKIEAMGWKADTTLEAGLKSTVDWYVR
jgi:GDP-L-fucose synthase